LIFLVLEVGIEPAGAKSRRALESDFGILINDTEGVKGEQDEERVEASVWHRGRPSAAKGPKGNPGKREGGMERESGMARLAVMAGGRSLSIRPGQARL